ncbi:MAG: VanZ family protein [Ancrocorticia sp.]
MSARLNRWLRWGAVVVWMAVIFFFSHQVGEDSGGLSDSIVAWLHSLGIHISPEMLGFLVRKAAHMTEYAVLAILLFVALRGSREQRFVEARISRSQRLRKRGEERGNQALISAFVIAVIYAATDEFHQLFIPGRTGTPKDVLIDSAGAAIGLALAWLVSRWRNRA